MKAEEKQQILALREQGMGYKRIAFELGLNVNSVKSFYRRNTTKSTSIIDGVCRQCGMHLDEDSRGRKFCSPVCRSVWWNKNRQHLQGKHILTIACKACGKPFKAYRWQGRKYCSHACYIQNRFGGRK